MAWYGGYGGSGGWAPYVSIGQKIALGKAAAKQLAKKEGREPCPVTIEGRKIAKTFWGLKWCENLERYKDFANRLPRGATYVRNGSVADLMIEPGRVRAIVGGSEAYTIEIKIKRLPPKTWKEIGRDCAQEIDSLFDLLQGKFSDGVMQRLTHPENGLFPHKNEISMKCSCPDFADVCKHIAATFYGVAARLDRQPELLFKLRNVDHLELIGQATDSASLDQALCVDGQALADSDLGSMFGIELETSAPRRSRRGKKAIQSTPKKSKATDKKSKATMGQPTPQARASVRQAAKSQSPATRISQVQPVKSPAKTSKASQSAIKGTPKKSGRQGTSPTAKTVPRSAPVRKSKSQSQK